MLPDELQLLLSWYDPTAAIQIGGITFNFAMLLDDTNSQWDGEAVAGTAAFGSASIQRAPPNPVPIGILVGLQFTGGAPFTFRASIENLDLRFNPIADNPQNWEQSAGPVPHTWRPILFNLFQK